MAQQQSYSRFPDGALKRSKFDLVVSSYILKNLNKKELIILVQNLKKNMNIGGSVLVKDDLNAKK